MGIPKGLNVDTFPEQPAITLTHLLQQWTCLVTQRRDLPLLLSQWPHRQPARADLVRSRQDGTRFWRDKRVFLLLYCLCIASAAQCCASCRFPGRWPMSSWPAAATVCHPASGTQSFAINWGFFPQFAPFSSSASCVFQAWEKSRSETASQPSCLPQPCLPPCSLQLLQLFCAGGGKAGEMPAAEKCTAVTAWVILGQNYCWPKIKILSSASQQPFWSPWRWASGCRDLPVRDSLRCLSQLLQETLVLAQGKKKSCDFACEIQLELVLNSPGHSPVYIRSYFIVHSGLENPTAQSKYLRGKSLHIEINSKVEVGCLLKQGWGSRAEQTSISFTLRPWLFSFFFLTYDWYLGPPAPLPSKGQTDLSCLTCKTE